MSTTSVEINNGRSIVHVEGPAVIDTVAQIHAQIRQVLDNRLPVELDLSAVEECDSSFLQLAVSLCNSLSRQGNALTLGDHSAPEAIRQESTRLGFTPDNPLYSSDENRCALVNFIQRSPENAGGQQ